MFILLNEPVENGGAFSFRNPGIAVLSTLQKAMEQVRDIVVKIVGGYNQCIEH